MTARDECLYEEYYYYNTNRSDESIVMISLIHVPQFQVDYSSQHVCLKADGIDNRHVLG